MIDADFVAAIVASPDDPAARSVYADWLEDRGDPRAELVRIEAELWREPIDLVRVRRLIPRRIDLRRDVDPRWYVAVATPSLAEIRRRLQHLAALDPGRKLDQHHEYRLRPPVTEAQVAEVEARIGCRLPHQYRRFVLELGDGGTGPDYGIASITKLEGNRATPVETPTTIGEMKRAELSDGAFAICEVGCGIFYYLILSGPDAGVVWYDGDGNVVPAPVNGSWQEASILLASPREARAEFVTWYANWLDDTLWSIARFTADKEDIFERPPEQVTDVNLAKITIVPEGLRRLTETRRLDLGGCAIESLPAWIGELSKLEWLTLDRTALRELPEAIGELQALQHLSCFHAEQLARLPLSLGRLRSLVTLDLRNCALRELPETFGELGLSELHVHHNPLATLPASIGKLRKLRSLDLSFCRIRDLPDAIAELPELTEINLRANELTHLPEVIGRCARLETLWLMENPGLDLADALRTLARVPTLRRLSLSSLGLVTLPDEIGLLTELRYLYLSQNDLTGLPDSITNLTKLREIDLQGRNNLRVDWDELWERIPSLGTSGDNCEMLADVTIPDGTAVAVGEPFVKTWRLRNTGDNPWVDGYRITHVDGPDFGAPGHEVVAQPGEEIEVSLEMTASEPGLQRSSWQIANAYDDPFGDEFYVEIEATD